MATAFVTGGTGFVGSRLISMLVDRGWQVKALHRSPDGAAKLEELGAEPVLGTLESLTALSRGIGDATFGQRKPHRRSNPGLIGAVDRTWLEKVVASTSVHDLLCDAFPVQAGRTWHHLIGHENRPAFSRPPSFQISWSDASATHSNRSHADWVRGWPDALAPVDIGKPR